MNPARLNRRRRAGDKTGSGDDRRAIPAKRFGAGDMRPNFGDLGQRLAKLHRTILDSRRGELTLQYKVYRLDDGLVKGFSPKGVEPRDSKAARQRRRQSGQTPLLLFL